MKTETGNKIRLGILVSISILVFIGAIYFIGQRQQLFSSTFQISGIFKDISGLQVGNNVRFSGINVGIVEGIEQITDSTVQVDMLIEEHTRKFMKKNAKAIIGTDGLMGNKIISIIPGTPGKSEIASNDFVETTVPINIDDILLKIKTTSDNSASISGNLAAIVQNIRNGKGTIGELFMDSTLALNVNEAMVNIKQGAGGFKENMNAASHNFLLKGFFKKKKEEAKKKTGK
ncbi:MAG TPA: MlaD family protein [Bacteroidia bacterium]|nr:MlaD family protein [Bacteroidia bacterium]